MNWSHAMTDHFSPSVLLKSGRRISAAQKAFCIILPLSWEVCPESRANRSFVFSESVRRTLCPRSGIRKGIRYRLTVPFVRGAVRLPGFDISFHGGNICIEMLFFYFNRGMPKNQVFCEIICRGVDNLSDFSYNTMYILYSQRSLSCRSK